MTMKQPTRGSSLPQRRLCLLWGAGLLLAPVWPRLAAQPADAPAARLRFSLERDAARLEVGEALVVRLEVWVSTWFQAPVEFPATLAAEGALVEVVGGSPDSRFEEQGGRRWTGLIRRYRVLPVQPGALSVALAAPLQVQPGGGNGRPRSLSPPAPLRLNVRLPAGAEDIQPFVAARRLELRQRWWPETAVGTAPLQAGDLVRREIVLVTDSSSPLLAPPDLGAPSGATVRVQAAEQTEQRATADATPTLTRRQQATYTLQRPGRVELPAVEIVWWDLNQRRRRVTRLDALSLDVVPAQALADPFQVAPRQAPASAAASGSDGSMSRQGFATSTLLAGLLTAAALAAGVAWRRHSTHGPAQPTERAIWRQLRRACRQCDAAAADAALQAALARLAPSTRQFWQEDAALCAARDGLERHRFSPGGAQEIAGWCGLALWQAVYRLRRAPDRSAADPALPALHP